MKDMSTTSSASSSMTVLATPTSPSISSSSSLRCSPCGGIIDIVSSLKPVDTYYGSQPEVKFVEDAAGMTEEQMKQIVKDCFGEIEKVQKEKPVPGSRRVKFEANIFDYAGSLGSLGSLNMLL